MRKKEEDVLKNNEETLREILAAIKESRFTHAIFVFLALSFVGMTAVSMFASEATQKIIMQIAAISVFALWGVLVIVAVIVESLTNEG